MILGDQELVLPSSTYSQETQNMLNNTPNYYKNLNFNLLQQKMRGYIELA